LSPSAICSNFVLDEGDGGGVLKKEPAARAGAGQSKSIPEETSPQSKGKSKSSHHLLSPTAYL
jgi:hypothetical protein